MMNQEFDINSSSKWEERYSNGDIGWDIGEPTPIFVNISKNLNPGKVCILGCGNGYDAIMLSQKGFDVTAVDFAPSPIKYINKKAKELSLNINTIQKNIFSLTPNYNSQFDYIIEQTCYCAIDPKKRNEYGKLVFDLLKPGGRLIGLWFPLDKKIEEGGPPHAVSEQEIKTLFNKGWVLIEERFPKNSIEPRLKREKLIIFEKL